MYSINNHRVLFARIKLALNAFNSDSTVDNYNAVLLSVYAYNALYYPGYSVYFRDSKLSIK